MSCWFLLVLQDHPDASLLREALAFVQKVSYMPVKCPELYGSMPVKCNVQNLKLSAPYMVKTLG